MKLTTKKKGRKIVGLRFDFKVDDQMQLDLEESSTAGRSKSKNLSKMADENTKNLVAKYGKKQA